MHLDDFVKKIEALKEQGLYEDFRTIQDIAHILYRDLGIYLQTTNDVYEKGLNPEHIWDCNYETSYDFSEGHGIEILLKSKDNISESKIYGPKSLIKGNLRGKLSISAQYSYDSKTVRNINFSLHKTKDTTEHIQDIGYIFQEAGLNTYKFEKMMEQQIEHLALNYKTRWNCEFARRYKGISSDDAPQGGAAILKRFLEI